MRTVSAIVWEYMISDLIVGDDFTTADVVAGCNTDPDNTAAFLSRLRRLGVLKVKSKEGHKYIWEIVEFKDVGIGAHGSHSSRPHGKAKKPAHVVTYADLGMTPPTSPRKVPRPAPTPPPVPTSDEVVAATGVLLSGLNNLGKELLKFRREVLAATSTMDLLAELARREKRRGDH